MNARAERYASAISRSHLIARPRLDELLLGRFDHRLSTICAPAGSGKTSVIASAIENNRLDPRGVDAYVALSTADDSGAAVRGRILVALGRPDDTDDAAVGLSHVIDAVWTHAPDEVAVILDDAHLLGSDDARAALIELADRLPANGHLVLSSRGEAPIPIARLRAHRAVLEIDQRQLGFDDDELDALRRARAVDEGMELPRHAATADLSLAVGASAGSDFLREEVLAGLGDDRLFRLRQVSVLDELDHDLVEAMTDGEFGADELLGDLPLVERRTDGTIRLHALLREALDRDLDPADRRKACVVAAELLAARNRFAASIRLSIAAGDEITARDLARAFVSVPTMNQSAQELREVTALVERIDDDGPLVELLRAGRRFDGLVPESLEVMRSIADAARERGDDELEALALHRSFQVQMFDLDLDDIAADRVDRLEELADRVPFARGALAHLRSQLAQACGDAGAALAHLDDYDGLGHENRLVTVSQRLCDLGLVEQVGEGLTPDDLATLPEGTEVFIAFAMWLRGEESPEFAHDFVGALLVDVARRGITDTLVSTLGVATSIALAAGDPDEAIRRAEWAGDLVDGRSGNMIRHFATVARAAVAAAVESDEAAAGILAAAPPEMAVGAWPQRAHLLELPLVYAVCPEARGTLDRIDLGPALATAVRAGRAVVALRGDGDAGPARDLPWSQIDLLRVHVLPHHLTELACAAAATGSTGAEAALGRIPQLDRHLARVAATSGSVAGAHAARLLGSRPRVAPHDLHVELLGPTRLRRDGDLVDAADWVRRSRVRELLALLCERRQVGRIDVLGELWPDVDDGKADANLRTTLSRLQRVLEPHRSSSDDPYFVRAERDVLVLHPDVTTDVDRFERTIERARQTDEAGGPARALELYVEALESYRGDYALGLDVGWAVLPRMRLRALATNAMCRVGELTAARGDPELAARWAERAQAEDPLNERAAAIFVSALAASGDRTGASHAVASIESAFADAGVTISTPTGRVFDRWRRPA